MARGRPGKKREREFISMLKASFIERGAFFFKIPDMPHFEGAKFRFDLPKPFDAFGNFAGQSFAIEAKVISRFKDFTVKDLRPSQIEGLSKWEMTGGRGFVFVFLWQQGRPELCMTKIYRLIIIPWERLRSQKRITKAEMVCSPFYPRYGKRLPDGKLAYRFDVDPFLVSLFGLMG